MNKGKISEEKNNIILPKVAIFIILHMFPAVFRQVT
jgi:hypothetical protein